MTKKQAAKARALLAQHIEPWTKTNDTPANWVRLTGMGVQVAIVDRWCGGYQDVHDPITIGWKAQRGCQVESGVIVVDDDYEAPIDAAIRIAKAAADHALLNLGDA